MTSCTDSQIRAAYEVNNMTPEQISDDLGFAIEAVKAKLMQVSSKYRKDCGQESVETDDLNFSDDQLRRVNDRIYDLAVGSEDEHLAFKAATYIRDDKKGRKEIVKAVGNQSFNIFQINTLLQQARAGAGKIKSIVMEQSDKQIVNV